MLCIDRRVGMLGGGCSKVEISLTCSIRLVYNIFDGFHGAFLIGPFWNRNFSLR